MGNFRSAPHRPFWRWSGFVGHRLDGQRMYPVLQLIGQHPMNHAMPLEAGFSGKRPRHDANAKVAFALGPGAGMTGMKVAFISDVQLGR